MKRRVLSLFALLAFSMSMASAQDYVVVSGTVTDIQTGLPIYGQSMHIFTDSLNTSGYYNVVFTDSAGYYSDQVPGNPAGMLTAMVYTTDCNQIPVSLTGTQVPGTNTIVLDFQICGTINPVECDNYLTYSQSGAYHVSFSGFVIPNTVADYFWDFGDNQTATGQFVEHTFSPSPTGYYNVTLTTLTNNNSSDSCVAVSVQQVWISNGGGGDCESYFTYDYVALSVNFNAFTNSPNYTFYTWEFGDGTTGSGEEITHNYANPGSYLVHLHAFDSVNCVSDYTEWITLGDTVSVLSGMIYYDSVPADQAYVYLFATDSMNSSALLIDTTLAINGVYSFNESGLPMYGVYYIQAELTEQSSKYGNYLPTYHLNALSWTDAGPIILTNTTYSADVYLVPSELYTAGNGQVQGVVSNQCERDEFTGV